MAAKRAKRDHYRYRLRRPDGTLIESGITKRPLDVRLREHRRKYPRATIHQEGPRVSEKTAREWEKRQKTGTPPGGKRTKRKQR